MNHQPPYTLTERDEIVLDLYEQLLEVERRLIPTGLHILGHVPEKAKLVDMLRAVASYDRPERGTRSLLNLIASGLGAGNYSALVKESAESEDSLRKRERIESIAQEAIALFVGEESSRSGTTDSFGTERAIAYLEQEAGAPRDESLRVFQFLGRICVELSINRELDALVKSLRGEYIEPGPGADIIQNPDILPTGRNTHAVNPYGIPSVVAFQKSEAVVGSLLERYRVEKGRYPQAIGMVLWGMDNIKTQGEGVAQALWLLGVEPRRDGLNRVTDVDVIPLDRLGRPRIDVVMTVSGIFRDLFGATMDVLDKAVRRVAALDEPSEMNFLRKHVTDQMGDNVPFENAAVRLFSNAPGSYGTNVNFMVLDSQWMNPDELGNLFVTRKSFAYGRQLDGEEARGLLEQALEHVEMTYQNLDNTEIGITDVDHYFEYLGGLSQAVERRAGTRPQVYLSDSLSPLTKVRSLEELVRLETRAKTLNPKWYEGMLKHGFRGVAEIESHVSNTFGWSATTQVVENWIYDEIARTFVIDEEMRDRLRSLNPHSTRNLVGRLLEAHGRGLWSPDDGVLEQLRDAFGDIENQLEGVFISEGS